MLKYEYPQLPKHKFHVEVCDSLRCPMHGHDFLEVSYVTSGRMEHVINGERTVVEAGDYFIVDYGIEHQYQSLSEEPLQVVNLLFFPEFVDRTLAGFRSFEDVMNSYLLRFSYKTLRVSPTGQTFHDGNGRIRAIVEELRREYTGSRYGYVEYIRCLLVELLILTVRKIGKNEQAVTYSELTRELVEYVNLHYAEKVHLSDLASAHNYSAAYVSRRFSEEIGMSFSEYLQRIRIEQVCRLLEQTDLQIGEIASRVGYENVKYFNKVFRRTLNLTPREFRKRGKRP